MPKEIREEERWKTGIQKKKQHTQKESEQNVWLSTNKTE